MPHPKAVVTINGAPVAGLFYERLISVTVHDREGERADSIDLDLEDGPPHIGIPQNDDLIEAMIGYADAGPVFAGVTLPGLAYMGSYRVSDVSVKSLPWTIKVQGKAADMRKGLKEHKERHWDNETIGAIAGQIAGEVGLIPQVAPSIAAFQYEWWGQQNESAMHMLHRLAERHNGLFTVKAGRLIIAEKGSGQTPSGESLPPLILTPLQIVRDTCEVHFGQRPKVKSVTGEHYDRKQAKRVKTEAPGESGAEAGHTLRHAHANKAESYAHAQSKAKQLKRDGTTTSVEIEGDPSAKAGRPFSYAGVRPGVDGISFIIEEAAHTVSRSGYRTKITGKLQV